MQTRNANKLRSKCPSELSVFSDIRQNTSDLFVPRPMRFPTDLSRYCFLFNHDLFSSSVSLCFLWIRLERWSGFAVGLCNGRLVRLISEIFGEGVAKSVLGSRGAHSKFSHFSSSSNCPISESPVIYRTRCRNQLLVRCIPSFMFMIFVRGISA